MNRRHFLQSIAAGAAMPLGASGHAQSLEGVKAPTQVHHATQPWFHQAGMGLFLHWGPSSVAEIEISWSMYEDAAQPNPYWPVERYRALADRFDPQNYDPELWMETAAAAGFKYAALTTRHHDGYALWPSDYGNFSTKQHLNGRDLLTPYVEACRHHGIKVGFYYSPTDWLFNPPGWPHLGFPHRDAEFHHSHPQRLGIPKFVDMPAAELQHYFDILYAYVKGQVTELLTRYGPIDLMWWDGYDWPDGIDIHGEELQAYCRRLQPNMVQNDRLFIWGPNRPLGDFSTEFESRSPAKRPEGDWEQCQAMCGGWSYRGESMPCRPPSYLIERLARDRAWGGNWLPDFGPRADGTLSPHFYAICDEMADWMNHSGISVFDVEAGPYPEHCDAPVTRKNGTWYVHLLPPARQATLTGVNPPKSARLLRTGESATIKVSHEKIILVLELAPATDLDEVVEVRW